MNRPRTIETDVVIVGGGPTGAASAWRLASAGRAVTVIERGDWFDYASLRRDAPDWEGRRARELHSIPTSAAAATTARWTTRTARSSR